MSDSLAAYLLSTPLPAAYLLPNFVTEQEESYLLQKIEELAVRQTVLGSKLLIQAVYARE